MVGQRGGAGKGKGRAIGKGRAKGRGYTMGKLFAISRAREETHVQVNLLKMTSLST